MDENQSLRKNSFVSLMSLFFHSGYSAVLGFAANIALTVFLEPKIFGIYITVLSVIALLNYFSDIGLAASLIQRKEISDDDVKTAFTIQQILIVGIVLLAFMATNVIVEFYNLPYSGKVLFWSLLISFFLSSLKTIPSVFLERNVQYQKIVLVQIVENTVFYVLVIFFAWRGFELLSFAYSVIARAFVGVVLIYAVSFWIPRIGISRISLRHLLSFGVPFQSMSFMALVKDEFVNLFLGRVIGFEALGYIGWAKKWAESPLRIIMDNLSKVTFPVFARIQKDKEKQSKLIEKLVKYQTLVMLPATIGLVLVIPLLVEIIPKYQKWRVALPIFYIFALSGFLSSYSTPFINFFNGIGKVKISLGFMIAWTALTWILLIPLTHMYGIYGFPLLVLILSTTAIAVVKMAKKEVTFELLKNVVPAGVAGGVMGLILYIIANLYTISSYLGIILFVCTGVVLYWFIIHFVFKLNVRSEINSFLKKE